MAFSHTFDHRYKCLRAVTTLLYDVVGQVSLAVGSSCKPVAASLELPAKRIDKLRYQRRVPTSRGLTKQNNPRIISFIRPKFADTHLKETEE
jgi:hypothetical protein